MEKRYTAASLKEAIKALEIKQEEQGKQVKQQLLVVYENLKPVNIFKNIIYDLKSAENLKHEFFETAVGVASGFFTKKLITGKSNNPFLKLFGLALQFGITTAVTKHYNKIRDAILNALNHFIQKSAEKDARKQPGN